MCDRGMCKVSVTQIDKTEELRKRTKRFALRIIRLYRSLPLKNDAQVLGKQVLRRGTSVGANYRAAGRARSRAEFASKLGIVVEEIDETGYWLELMIESGIVSAEKLTELCAEARELTAIFTRAQQTARGR